MPAVCNIQNNILSCNAVNQQLKHNLDRTIGFVVVLPQFNKLQINRFRFDFGIGNCENQIFCIAGLFRGAGNITINCDFLNRVFMPSLQLSHSCPPVVGSIQDNILSCHAVNQQFENNLLWTLCFSVVFPQFNNLNRKLLWLRRLFNFGVGYCERNCVAGNFFLRLT